MNGNVPSNFCHLVLFCHTVLYRRDESSSTELNYFYEFLSCSAMGETGAAVLNGAISPNYCHTVLITDNQVGLSSVQEGDWLTLKVSGQWQ